MQHTSRAVCAKESKEKNSALHHPEEPADFCAFISQTWNYLSLGRIYSVPVRPGAHLDQWPLCTQPLSSDFNNHPI